MEKIEEKARRIINRADTQLFILNLRLRGVEVRLKRAVARRRYNTVHSLQLQHITLLGVKEIFNDIILKQWELLATIEFQRITL